MRRWFCRGLWLFALTAGACAHRGPLGTTDGQLDLERIVLYRNGVGYFERHGEVDDDVLRIRVRRDQINDLLKSLTVLHRGTGKAVSISMPLDPESWASAALSGLGGEGGSLAEVLDGLRGTAVTLQTTEGRLRGRIVMVEEIVGEPSDEPTPLVMRTSEPIPPERDHKITLLEGNDLKVIRLSKVKEITLQDGDLALQLHRRLDGSAGEGMFQQVEVDIRLAGAKQHDLVVSYVVEAPMWKPTYRVVLPEHGKGQALLQGWAVVDNTSGEDWSGVRLALTSGEPIAFRYDLHTPREVDRVDLTESGVRNRARVAVGETTFDEDAEPEPEPKPDAESDSAAAEQSRAGDDEEGDDFRQRDAFKKDQAKEKRAATGASAGAPPPSSAASPATPQPALDADVLRRSTLVTARAAQVSGMTRYDLRDPVTVPNGSSTMVAILNEQVHAEETFLYKPGGAGIGYDSNPYRVVRFKNTTPFVLESGPISIYSGGSFVGEGLSQAVGTGTSATIPFAVEPGILVSSRAEHTGDEMRLIRIVRGMLEVETFARTVTTWTAKGLPNKAGYTVLVRHPKAGWNYEIANRPAGTEDLPDAYLVPLLVRANRQEGSIQVTEQTPSRTTLSIWDGRAVGLLEQLMVAADLGPVMRKKLDPIVAARQEIGRIDTQIEGLERQKIELDQRADQTRQNLEAIKKDAAAGTLRRNLSKRLEEFTSEADRIGRRIVELQSQRLEKKIELEDMLQDLDFDAPAAKPTVGIDESAPTPAG